MGLLSPVSVQWMRPSWVGCVWRRMALQSTLLDSSALVLQGTDVSVITSTREAGGRGMFPGTPAPHSAASALGLHNGIKHMPACILPVWQAMLSHVTCW